MNSWQLAHLSSLVPAGDYSKLTIPEGVKWGVRVIIPKDDGIVAVQHTKEDDSFWVLAGGGVEKGETIFDAAIREVQEETNLTIRIERLLYVRQFNYQVSEIEFYILANIESGILSLGNDPELNADSQILSETRMISFDELENDDALTFYPIFMRKRLRTDLKTPPTKSLYIGTSL